MIDAELLTTVTAESVHFASNDEVDAVREELLRRTNVFESGADVRDAETLFSALAATMNFPDYFGRSWDSVVDCLRDVLPAGPRRGVVLILHHARALWREDAEAAGALVETWLSVAEERRGDDESFHLVFAW